MSNDDEFEDFKDLSGPIPTSPSQLALTVERLRGVVQRLKEKTERLEKVSQIQVEKIEDLERFKSEIATGSKVAAWLATGTIALLGILAAFFSGIGNRIFSGGH